MNHLTTEPTESKSGDGSYASVAFATGAIAASSATGESAGARKSNKPRPTFVPPLDPTVGIELRVTRAGMPARRLRINTTRCTFGSGEGCTVRLSDASLRPLHAVILRDSGRILIRGYSVPLEINGESLAESFLSLGDVIRLGQYCFEMIDLPMSGAVGEEYEDEPIQRAHGLPQHGESINAKIAEPPKQGQKDHQIAIDEGGSGDTSSSSKRLKFSQTVVASRPNLSGRSGSESVLEGLQFSQSGIEVFGSRDDAVDDAPTVREPVTSLAQIHVQAKRNSELMADLAAARQRERETDEKRADAIQRLEVTQAEVAEATQSVVALKTEIVSLNDQVLKVTSDAQDQLSLAVAEQAKLNRTIATLRESGVASQKAEATTRQALQESIRQRDEVLAQRTMAVDAQQLTRAKLEEAEAQIRRMSQDAESASSRLTRFESEVEKYRGRIDELKDVCCGQADQITKLSTALEASQDSEIAAVTRLKNTVDQLQKELDASRLRVSVADVERLQLNTLQATLDSTLQEHISEKLAWGSQVERLNQSLGSLSGELRSTTEQLSRSRNDSSTLQSQISEMRLQITGVEAELSLRPTAEQLQEVRTQLAEREIDLENAERQLAELREDYDQLASQQLASHRVAEEPIPDVRLSTPTANDQAGTLQSQSFTAPLPSSLFPVPAFSESAKDDELPVEATHASNEQSTWQKSSPAPQKPVERDAAPVNESSWNAPSPKALSVSSSRWNVSDSKASEGESLQPSVADSDQSHEPETQSQWLKSSQSRTEMMKAETGETPFHTEPMDRYSQAMCLTGDESRADADFTPTSRFEDAEIDAPAFSPAWSTADSVAENLLEDETIDSSPVEDESDVEEASLLAALIERSEGPASNWFADYTANQAASAEAIEPEEEEGNEAVLARLSQYVRENDSSEDEISAAIAESEHNGLDPETSALSLARMLINELDSATQNDHDSKVGISAPDPMVKSKRLVGASVSEAGVGGDDETSDDDNQASEIELRRKDFDERAFRDSLADSADEDVMEPNADEAAYPIRSEVERLAESAATQSSQVVAEEEEDSVEAYMNQLLRRMGQEPLAPAKPVEDAAKSVAVKFSTPQPREAKQEKPEIVRPRRPAPELDVPMDQMRKLANESAESAISTSNRKGAKEMRSRALVDGAQAGVVVICSLVFFYCGMTSSNLSLVWNTAGSLAIALSAFFFYEMFRKLTASTKTP